MPLDLDDGKLAGDWVWGQDWGSLRPQRGSAPQCHQDAQWALARQWRQRGEMTGAEAWPAGRLAQPFTASMAASELLLRSWGECHAVPSWPGGRGEKRRASGSS